MSLVVASPTVPQIEGVARIDVFKRFLRETGMGAYGVCTAEVPDTSSILDTTRFQSTQYVDKDWEGGWTRISKAASGNGDAPEDEVRPISDYAPSSGDFTANPVFSAAVNTSDEFELWKFPNPTIVKDLLDELLKQEIYLPCWTILTEIPDGDMEQSSASADWTASNATVTKQTSEPLMGGLRKLRVVATSTDGYARSALLNVEPGKSYYVSALVRTEDASTTASLIAYDETNSTAIDNKTVSKLNIVRLWFEFTAPSTCYQVSIRLSTVTNNKYSEWDEVCFYPQDASDIALPWWVRNKDQVKGIFSLRANEVATNQLDGLLRGEGDNRWDIRDNAFGRGQLRLVARHGTMHSPLFIFGTRNETAYADDNDDKKMVDATLLNAGLIFKAFEHLAQAPVSNAIDRKWVVEERNKWQVNWAKLQRQQSSRLDDILQSPTPDGEYIDGRFVFGEVG